MVVGFAWFWSEGPSNHSRTQQARYRPVSLDGSRVIKKGVANAVNVRRCRPCVNTFCSPDLVRGRAITAVRADENRRLDFAAKVFKKSGQQDNRAWHVMRKLA